MVLCRKFRPERLTFDQHHHHHSCCPNVAAAAAAVTCAQEARLAESSGNACSHLNQQHQCHIVSGGFANFAAAYPQYCESRCPAVAVDTVDGGACCQQQQQHARQFLVEPSYTTNQGPTQLLSFVYVGSQADACDADVIRRHGITHVLNVSANCPQSEHVAEANFMRVPVNDGYADKLLPHFKRAFQFLDNVRRSNGRCLVHCLAGVSRSPTLAIAYIMQHRSMSQDEAYRFVKARRPSISPNFNFLGQLLEFERQLQQFKPTGADQAVETSATVVASSSDCDDSDSACSEAKRQKRFCLTLPVVAAAPTVAAAADTGSVAASITQKGFSLSLSNSAGPSPTPTGALSRLSFTAQQQQQQQQHATVQDCDRRSSSSATKRRQRPLSEALDENSSSSTSSLPPPVSATATA